LREKGSGKITEKEKGIAQDKEKFFDVGGIRYNISWNVHAIKRTLSG